MVKSGARAEALYRALAKCGFVATPSKPAAPRIDQFSVAEVDRLRRLYSAMGGTDGRPLRPGTWDLAFRDGLVVELDEDMHFNRYRARTLEEPWGQTLPWALAYRDYASRWEHRAGTGGRRWTSASAEKMFGAADPDGVFGQHGSPRWKQRAFYDAMKDAAAESGLVRLARISIYDSINGVTVENVLRGRLATPHDALRALVFSRVTKG